MEFKFSKDGDNNFRPEPAAEKKNQGALLVLLLLLVGGFSYLYFFTGLIRPEESAKAPEVPPSQMVKMPLPPRDAVTGKTESKTPDAKTEAAVPQKAGPLKNDQPAPVVAVTPQAGPAKSDQPATAAAVAPVAKMPAQAAAKPLEQPKKTEPVPSAGNKPIAPDKKTATAKADIKKVSTAAAVKTKLSRKAVNPVKRSAGVADMADSRSVMVGSYILEDALSTDMGRVRKAGFTPVVKPGARKKSTMNRLFLAEFTERFAAQAELNKLKRHTSDAFILDQAGKHAVYAGSYLLYARAATEMERLGAAGFKLSLKSAQVEIPTQSLSIGPFNSKKTADAALSKLKSAGIKATLFRQ